MVREVFKDRFGQEIKLGTRVMFAMYDRDSSLYVGKVERVTVGKIHIGIESHYRKTRQVLKKDVSSSLISIETLEK